MTDESDTRRFRWLLGAILASGLALMAGAAVLRGARAGSSVAVGVAMATLNVVAMRPIVRALTAAAAGTSKGGGAAGLLIGMKLAILLGVVWLLLSRHVVLPTFLGLGYLALPIGVAIGTLLCDKALAPPED